MIKKNKILDWLSDFQKECIALLGYGIVLILFMILLIGAIVGIVEFWDWVLL